MRHLLLVVLGVSVVGSALAVDRPTIAEGKASNSGSGLGQVPESLKRKFKPTAIVKKPVVVK